MFADDGPRLAIGNVRRRRINVWLDLVRSFAALDDGIVMDVVFLGPIQHITFGENVKQETTETGDTE